MSRGVRRRRVLPHRRAVVIIERRELGPRFSWLAIAVFFGPIALLVHDVSRRYCEVRQRQPKELDPSPLASVQAGFAPFLPDCVCTGSGDPLCSEIPGQTCAPR